MPPRKFPGGSSSSTRNRLIHGYLGIDNDTLWSIIRDDIPIFLPELRKLKQQLDDQKNQNDLTWIGKGGGPGRMLTPLPEHVLDHRVSS